MVLVTRAWKKLAGWFTAAPAPRDFEADLERVYTAVLRPGDVALDLGAHLGRHTRALAEAVGATGKVFAFEPLPACRRQLEAALAGPWAHLRDRVALSAAALAAAPGEAEFTVAVDLPAYSGLRERAYDAPTRRETIRVRVEALDDYFTDLTRCRFIKVDTEGGEYDALRGGAGLLRRLRPVVGFEFGLASCAGYGVEPRAMGELWQGLGYELYDITGRALGVAEFAASATEQRVWDYLAVPREDAAARAAVRRACAG